MLFQLISITKSIQQNSSIQHSWLSTYMQLHCLNKNNADNAHYNFNAH